MASLHRQRYSRLTGAARACRKISYNLVLTVCFAVIIQMAGCKKPDETPANSPLPVLCSKKNSQGRPNTITAEVVALEQIITFNRFGAFNPVGMILCAQEGCCLR